MELRTKDLTLRMVGYEDIGEVARMWSFENGTIPLDEAEKAIEYMQNNHMQNKMGQIYHLCFAIFKKEKNKIIGWCGLDGKTDGKLYIFYSIDAAYRNRGFATQCAERLLSYAFNEARVPYVNGGCDKHNIASYKVMVKIGMKKNGFEENGDPLFFIDNELYRRNQLTVNFKRRNIHVLWFDSFNEIKMHLLQQIPSSAKVGIGNSKTLKSMDITKALCDRGNVVFDKTLGKTPDEVRELKRNALLTDCYISGANAISVDGRIVNIDHSGNRVAAIAYGPDKVYIVVGKNKISMTHDEAMKRARTIAAPLNAKRAGYNPPCIALGCCVDCLSPERVCYNFSIVEGQHVKNRLTLLIANEEEGF